MQDPPRLLAEGRYESTQKRLATISRDIQAPQESFLTRDYWISGQDLKVQVPVPATEESVQGERRGILICGEREAFTRLKAY